MEHRREKRWKTEVDLVIEVIGQPQRPPVSARLVDLSRNGARIQRVPCKLSSGKAIRIWAPEARTPGHALVLYDQDEEAGLLWITRPAWADQ